MLLYTQLSYTDITALWTLVFLHINHKSEFIIEALKVTLTNSETEKSEQPRQIVN